MVANQVSGSSLLRTIVAVALLISAESLMAGGFRGGGGRGGGARVGGGGGARAGGMPHMGASRPSMPAARPSAPSRNVAASRPNVNSRPASRPNVPNVSRPSASRPNVNRTTASRPNLPSTRPGQLPGAGGNGGFKPSVPNRPDSFPAQRPSLPNLGDGSGLASRFPDRPGVPSNRLPNTRPGSRPGTGTKPSPGDVGDFLGIDGIRPDRPGLANRPNVNLPDRRPARPPLDRNDIGNGRLGRNDRPINIGQINVGNSRINDRIGWANIDNNRLTSIRNQWSGQINGLHGWLDNHPGRVGYWHGWADGVRFGWGGYHYHNNWFTGNWWYSHPGACCGWHYYYRFNYYPWSYWWRRPAWGVFGTWFAWSATTPAWSQPIYYDYGTGGNVTYQNNNVYINGQQVASAEEFAESAAALATVDPPASQEEAENSDWLPLGTFAVSTGEKDTEPNRVVQIAVNKQGIIAGTLYNYDTDKAVAVQGQVDKETQRVAFRLGDSQDVVAETGLYNLTQDEAPLLVHFGPDRVENYLLVRLEQDPSDDSQAATN
jgi:hypothetical protein